jgi:hypothetical protein
MQAHLEKSMPQAGLSDGFTHLPRRLTFAGAAGKSHCIADVLGALAAYPYTEPVGTYIEVEGVDSELPGIFTLDQGRLVELQQPGATWDGTQEHPRLSTQQGGMASSADLPRA